MDCIWSLRSLNEIESECYVVTSNSVPRKPLKGTNFDNIFNILESLETNSSPYMCHLLSILQICI